MNNMKITLDEALDILNKNVTRTSVEVCLLEDAGGRIAAEDICAIGDIPGFDKSAYDGYAFNADQTRPGGRILKNVGILKAGEALAPKVGPGECIRIMTGAKMPEGTDCVIKFEDTEERPEGVLIPGKMSSYENVVRKGEDVKAGELLIKTGEILDSYSMGIIASQGISKVRVFEKLKVGVITTGDEIVNPGECGDRKLENEGRIFDSNRYIFIQRLSEHGFESEYLGQAADNEDAIIERINKGVGKVNALVLTGGVSVGDYDLVEAALREMGARILFSGVRIKPGMACCYALYKDMLICGLSGNPASAITNFDIIALPMLKKMAGVIPCNNRIVYAEVAKGFSKVTGLRAVRGRIQLTEGKIYFVPSQGQGNVMLRASKGCDAYVLTQTPLHSGQIAEVTIINGD